VSRWTKAEYDSFKHQWLLERMAHTWSDEASVTRCTLCGAKYSSTTYKRLCKKRRKPNRWRMHFSRAVLHAQYPPEKPVTRDAGWIVAQLAEIRREVSRDERFETDLRFWKYHRLARRYRRLMREWWQLPTVQVVPLTPNHDTFGADLTRRRNKLLRQVQANQSRTVKDHNCVYTFKADARWNGAPLFTEKG